MKDPMGTKKETETKEDTALTAHADATAESIAAQLRANATGIPVESPKPRASTARSAYVAEAYRALVWTGGDPSTIAARVSELATAMEQAQPQGASWEQQAIAAATLSKFATMDGEPAIIAASCWRFAG